MYLCAPAEYLSGVKLVNNVTHQHDSKGQGVLHVRLAVVIIVCVGVFTLSLSHDKCPI